MVSIHKYLVLFSFLCVVKSVTVTINMNDANITNNLACPNPNNGSYDLCVCATSGFYHHMRAVCLCCVFVLCVWAVLLCMCACVVCCGLTQAHVRAIHCSGCKVCIDENIHR